MSKVKTVGYAYPTSEIACVKGFGKSGCWYVAVLEEDTPVFEKDIVWQCQHKQDLLDTIDTANLLSSRLQWSKYSMHDKE
jgi:hypothetical protein